MKKFLSIFLPALISAGSFFAQTSTVSGVWERGKPKAVKMFKIVDSNLSEIASSALGENGIFTMTFTPEYEGYYVLGISPTTPLHRYTFYLKPGDPLQVQITKDGYQLMGKDNTAENKEMAQWHDFISPLEVKALYSTGSTYVDFFPLLEKKLVELSSYKVKKTKNKTFDITFAKYRQYDLLANALQFIYSMRTAHPENEDFTDYYRHMDVPGLTTDTSILKYPGGLHLLLNAYMLNVKLSGSVTAEDRQKIMKDPAYALLKEDVGSIVNDTIKGEIALMFGRSNRTLAGLEEYQKEYGEFIVTDNQRERWQNIEKGLKKELEKKEAPVDFKFPDANGKEIALSDFRGKVVYIDIWATWCGPCKKEMPYLKELEEEYKDNKDIVFMGVSIDASKDHQKWKDFLVKEGLPGVQLFAGDEAGPTLSKPYKINGIPRFMLVGKDGMMIYMNAPRPSSTEIRAVLDEALKK